MVNATSGTRRGKPLGGVLNLTVPSQAHGQVFRESRPIRIGQRAQLGR